MPKRKASHFDQQVAADLQAIAETSKLSNGDIGDRLRLSAQSVRKYLLGETVVTLAFLIAFGEALDVDVTPVLTDARERVRGDGSAQGADLFPPAESPSGAFAPGGLRDDPAPPKSAKRRRARRAGKDVL